MIKVNLLPSGKKQGRARRRSISMPKIGGDALKDRWLVASIAVPVVAVAASVFMFMTVSSAQEEMDVALQAAVQDSVRFSDIARQTDLLMARADSVAQRVAIIQEIDEGRYVWSHVLDEVARALPDYTWLTGISDSGLSPLPELTITGRAGNNIAITVFMDQLTASPYIRGVDIVSSNQTPTATQPVYDFTLTAQYEQPPLFMLETVPLFGIDIPEVNSMSTAQDAPEGLR